MTDGDSDGSGGHQSLTSNMMTTKQYILVNLSKFVVEIVGTAVLGVFYLLMGDQQAGMLLGVWIITLFGVAISGAHFNPAVTVVFMLRRNSSFGSRRLFGILYIVAQFLGGFLAAVVSLFIIHGANNNVAVSPIVTISIPEDSETAELSFNWFSATISELVGSFMFVFLFMLCTDKKTQFSEDKVINCFIIGAAYVASRLIAGGPMVTVLYPGLTKDEDGNINLLSLIGARGVGPLLNPALAFGQMLLSWDFSSILQYVVAPLGGSALALVFYEFVFVKSQEYLNADDEDTENDGMSLQDGIESSPPKGKKIMMNQEIDDEKGLATDSD